MRDYAELVATARPYLRELAEKTGEATTLAIEVDGVAVSVDMVDTPRPFRREVAVGRIIGDTANASGKVFAAFKTGADRKEVLARPHRQLTPRTITDPEALAKELDLVAGQELAFDTEERNVGTCAVAAPVRDQLGDAAAVISVVVPSGRFGPKEKIRCARAVKSTAKRLSCFLGYGSTGWSQAVALLGRPQELCGSSPRYLGARPHSAEQAKEVAELAAQARGPGNRERYNRFTEDVELLNTSNKAFD